MITAQSDQHVLVEHIYFPSALEGATIHGVLWENANPSQSYKGIVQLNHGMAEYIERYDAFARFLVSQGYMVAGHDHICHGKSVRSQKEWGNLPALTGKNILIKDAHYLRLLVQERTGQTLPHVMFGHSMGSFVVRAYVSTYGNGLSGAIICGTGHQPQSKAGNAFARFLVSAKGNEHKSPFFQNFVMGAYAKAIPNAQTEYDWLNTNADKVSEYMADEACGFAFTVGGYAALTDLTAFVSAKESIARIPNDIALLLISGADDPVGDMSKGVKKVASLFKEAGKSFECKIYENMRHEILNEPDCLRVYQDVVQWLDRVTLKQNTEA